VQRIVSVRDQIAKEWAADLETLITANEMILDSYHDFQSAKRGKEANQTAKVEKATDAWSENVTVPSGLTAPYSSTYDKSFKAYDRSAMLVLGNNIVQDGRASSSFRKGNFDLLGLLATQESIHRVLRQYREASSSEFDISFDWLRQFYVARIASHFDGNQEYGRADDFLEELLIQPPSVKMSQKNGKLLGFIDPMRMAEDIIAMRTQVAQDWKDIVMDVPTKDHAELRSMCLSIRMGKTIDRSPSIEEPIRVDDGGFQ
jgi:hypothetical protein